MNSVLLIAEQPLITEIFTAMLSPAFTVLSAETEEKGQQILRENSRDIVAVLMELPLARKNGFALSESLKDLHEFSPIPMIAISDELPQPQDMDCIEHGFFDLIARTHLRNWSISASATLYTQKTPSPSHRSKKCSRNSPPASS